MSTTKILLSVLTALPVFLAGSNPEKPKHVLSSRYAETAGEADYAIARFMQKNCTDREAAIFYIPRTKTIVRIGKDAGIGDVAYNGDVMRRLIRSEPNIIEAHCHVMNLEAIVSAEPDFEKVLERIGPVEARERFWMEIPSPADILIALGIEAKVFAKHPDGSVGHRIVVVEPGLPPHVISYGLAAGEEIKLRELVQKRQYNTEAKMMYDGKYSLPLSSLDTNRCKPFIIEPSCVPVAAREAAEVTNSNNFFFVHDLGYLH